MASPRPPHLSIVSAAPAAVGVQLGSYTLLERLGVGGMAEVWKGTRVVGVGSTGKTVAIKLIAGHAALNPDYHRMFLREARVSLLLSHANIAQVFDVDIDPATSQVYMAMEYVHGLNLYQFIQRLRGDATSYPMIGYIIGEVLRGLTYAHEVEVDGENVSIVHRDISPHNIMVSTSGEVKITDFGIASIATEATTGTVRGKLQYMPPEQLLGDSRNSTVDLFSVGAVLHELIEGKPFRDAIDAARMYGLILSGAKPELNREDVPAGLRVLRDRLLEVDVSKRAPSARVALEYLYRWDGYRNASLDLGKLVKQLLARQEATVEFALDGSDTIAAGFSQPDDERESEAETQAVAPESQIQTERPGGPESQVATEQAPELSLPAIATTRGQTVQVRPPRQPATEMSRPMPVVATDRSNARTVYAVSAAILILMAVIVFAVVKGLNQDSESPAPVASMDGESRGSETGVADLPEPVVVPPDPSAVPEEPTSTETETGDTGETETETETGDTSIANTGDDGSDNDGPSRPPPPPRPPVPVTVTASSEYKLWVEIKIGTVERVIDWPEPSASLEIRPGKHWVKFRRDPDSEWVPAGRIQIPRSGPVEIMLQNDKFRVTDD